MVSVVRNALKNQSELLELTGVAFSPVNRIRKRRMRTSAVGPVVLFLGPILTKEYYGITVRLQTVVSNRSRSKFVLWHSVYGRSFMDNLRACRYHLCRGTGNECAVRDTRYKRNVYKGPLHTEKEEQFALSLPLFGSLPRKH